MVYWSDTSAVARRRPAAQEVVMRSPFASAAIPLAVLLVAASCGGSTPPAAVTTPSPAAPTVAAATPSPTPAAAVKVRAAYGNVTPANLAPFFAKDQGVFLKHGLDVDLPLIDGGGKAMAALLGNSVDIAQLGGTELMSAFVAGGDVEAVSLFVPV